MNILRQYIAFSRHCKTANYSLEMAILFSYQILSIRINDIIIQFSLQRMATQGVWGCTLNKNFFQNINYSLLTYTSACKL